MSINDTENSRGRGRPPKDTVQVGLRLERDLLEAVDKVQADFGKKSRSEAVRFVLKEWLQSQGRLPLDEKND